MSAENDHGAARNVREIVDEDGPLLSQLGRRAEKGRRANWLTV